MPGQSLYQPVASTIIQMASLNTSMSIQGKITVKTFNFSQTLSALNLSLYRLRLWLRPNRICLVGILIKQVSFFPLFFVLLKCCCNSSTPYASMYVNFGLVIHIYAHNYLTPLSPISGRSVSRFARILLIISFTKLSDTTFTPNFSLKKREF